MFECMHACMCGHVYVCVALYYYYSTCIFPPLIVLKRPLLVVFFYQSENPHMPVVVSPLFWYEWSLEIVIVHDFYNNKNENCHKHIRRVGHTN